MKSVDMDVVYDGWRVWFVSRVYDGLPPAWADAYYGIGHASRLHTAVAWDGLEFL